MSEPESKAGIMLGILIVAISTGIMVAVLLGLAVIAAEGLM